MTPDLVTVFLIAFVGGPVLFAALVQLPSRSGAIVTLGMIILGCAALAFWLTRKPEALTPLSGPLASLAALWLGWVLTLTSFVLALRPRMGSGRARRALFVAGLCATTLPWFGLATARMMT